MDAHPVLDLTGHEWYDPDSILQTLDDMMKTIFNAPLFLFLEFLKFSDRVMTFKEILASTNDEDEDYQGLEMKVWWTL